MPANQITVQTTVNAPIEKVWDYWNNPTHITHWAFASDDWECPKAENDLRVDGRLSTTMAAKDGTASFDFGGIYNQVEEFKLIDFSMSDGRNVHTEFTADDNMTHITQSFDPENENSQELQRTGWQAILDNFKTYTEQN